MSLKTDWQIESILLKSILIDLMLFIFQWCLCHLVELALVVLVLTMGCTPLIPSATKELSWRGSMGERQWWRKLTFPLPMNPFIMWLKDRHLFLCVTKTCQEQICWNWYTVVYGYAVLTTIEDCRNIANTA